jgi:hypothetical protein
MQTGWNRDGARGIVPLLNEAQNILLQNESEQMLYYDPTTGEFPTLNTVHGTFQYNAPTNIWRVGMILLAYPLNNLYNTYPLSNYGLRDNLQFPIRDVHFAGRRYIHFQQARCKDKNQGTPATIQFTVDPGKQTDLFRIAGYRVPIQITSESVQPEIPDRFHTSHLLPATVKLIEGFQTNNIAESRLWIEQNIQPDFWKQQNEGQQGRSGHTHRRGF